MEREYISDQDNSIEDDTVDKCSDTCGIKELPDYTIDIPVFQTKTDLEWLNHKWTWVSGTSNKSN